MGTEYTLERLNALLRDHGHRSNDGEFLWRSHWEEAGVLQRVALRTLNRVYRPGEPVYFILDDTQTLKRAEKMDAVGKSNRRFTTDGRSHPLRTYGANVLRRSGRWMNITGLRKMHSYRVAGRVGWMNKLGAVQVVFSRRRGDRKAIALVTNDLARPGRKVVADYLRRWAIKLLIKDEKQHLGLGACRVLRYRAVVRHMHLVDCAYACLTHLGMDAERAQGHQKDKTVLRLPPIRQLKAELRQAVWSETVKDVVKVSHERAVIRREI